MDAVHFLTTGFVTDEPKGPLSITVLTAQETVVIEVLGNAQCIRAELAGGMPLDAALKDLWSAQKVETRIPLSRIQSLSWIDGYRALNISYNDERGRQRRKATYIADDDERVRLIEQLEQQVGRQFQRHDAPAGIWKLAWSQLHGALISIVGTVVFLALWNPQEIGRVRGGWIALKLGPAGCATVGACFLAACLISAWLRVHPRPSEHQYLAPHL